MKKIKSFTLAEVLITLVVIGIIAAITVPLVIANHKRTETSAKLKKFYSAITNAIRLAEIENGTINMPDCRYENIENCYQYWFRTYIAKYMNYSKITEEYYFDDSGDTPNGFIDWPTFFVYLNDGTIMSFSNPNSDIIYIDINGEKGPNQGGRDIFEFDIASNCPNKVCEQEGSRDEILSSAKQYNSSAAYWGAQLIMKDGWEIKDDYPYKL